jgi:hypothetical protein
VRGYNCRLTANTPALELTLRRQPAKTRRLVDIIPRLSLIVESRRGFGASATMIAGMIGRSSIPVKVAGIEPPVRALDPNRAG